MQLFRGKIHPPVLLTPVLYYAFIVVQMIGFTLCAPYTSNPYADLSTQMFSTKDNQIRTIHSNQSPKNIHSVIKFLELLPFKGYTTAKKRTFSRYRHGQSTSYGTTEENTFMKPGHSRDIQCPTAVDGIKQFACATPDKFGEFQCIDDHMLCDNVYHCPNREDEDPTVCMFHRMTMNYFKVLLDAVFGLTRSIV